MLPCMIQVLPLSRLGLVWYTENSMQSFEYPPDVIKTDKFFLWTTSVVFLGKFEFDQVSRYRDFFFYFFGVPQSRLLVEKGYFKNLQNVNAACNARCICSVTCAFPPLLSLIKMVMDVSLWMSWNSASTFFIGPQPSRVWFSRQGRAYFDTILILTFQTKEGICWCHFLSGMLCFVNGTILRFLVMFKLLINTCCYSVLFYFFIYTTLSVNPSIHQWKWGWWMCVALLLPVKHPAFKSRQNTWCQKSLRLETKLLRILENGAVEHVFEGCKSEDVFFFQRERGPEKRPHVFFPTNMDDILKKLWGGSKKNWNAIQTCQKAENSRHDPLRTANRRGQQCPVAPESWRVVQV